MKRTALALAMTLGTAAVIEIALRVAGFGHPVLYENRSAYGYRPLPDQTRRRFGGAHVHINNLGTRGPDVSPWPAAG